MKTIVLFLLLFVPFVAPAQQLCTVSGNVYLNNGQLAKSSITKKYIITVSKAKIGTRLIADEAIDWPVSSTGTVTITTFRSVYPDTCFIWLVSKGDAMKSGVNNFAVGDWYALPEGATVTLEGLVKKTVIPSARTWDGTVDTTGSYGGANLCTISGMLWLPNGNPARSTKTKQYGIIVAKAQAGSKMIVDEPQFWPSDTTGVVRFTAWKSTVQDVSVIRIESKTDPALFTGVTNFTTGRWYVVPGTSTATLEGLSRVDTIPKLYAIIAGVDTAAENARLRAYMAAHPVSVIETEPLFTSAMPGLFFLSDSLLHYSGRFKSIEDSLLHVAYSLHILALQVAGLGSGTLTASDTIALGIRADSALAIARRAEAHAGSVVQSESDPVWNAEKGFYTAPYLRTSLIDSILQQVGILYPPYFPIESDPLSVHLSDTTKIYSGRFKTIEDSVSYVNLQAQLAVSWGNHSLAGYLTTYTDSSGLNAWWWKLPAYGALGTSLKIGSNGQPQWLPDSTGGSGIDQTARDSASTANLKATQAVSWGNHALFGYLVSSNLSPYITATTCGTTYFRIDSVSADLVRSGALTTALATKQPVMANGLLGQVWGMLAGGVQGWKTDTAGTGGAGVSSIQDSIWTFVSGKDSTATEFKIKGGSSLANSILGSLFTCTTTLGTRRIGYITTVTLIDDSIKCTVASDSDLTYTNTGWKIALNRKASDYLNLIRIPGEVTADTSTYQGAYILDLPHDSYLLPVNASVRIAATGSGVVTFNVYRNTNSTTLFGTAPNLATNTVLRVQRPTTITLSAGDNISVRILSSAGTIKASDIQIKLFIVPQTIWTAQ